MGKEYAEKLANQIKLMEELAQKIEQEDFGEAELIEWIGEENLGRGP
jgi:predicted XRE-type DNA-binding protein